MLIQEYLYVCHFSNGHIKVGRSMNPSARIASHVDRVACVGIDLVEYHIAMCNGPSEPREARLIILCAGCPGVTRHKSEWFAGLDYDIVCGWADSAANMDVQGYDSKIKSIRERLGVTQQALADGIGCTQGNIGHYERGQTMPPHMARELISFSARSGLVITFDHVYGDAPLPELVTPDPAEEKKAA